MTKKMMSQVFDEKEAARVLGVAIQTLRNWRHKRKGPAYHKIGKAVRYRMADLEAYLQECRIDPEESA